MKKLLLSVTLLLLTNAPVAAQEAGVEPPAPLNATAAEVERLLKSEGKGERAWGAHLAGLHGLKGQTPRLVELLSDPALAAGGLEEVYLRQAALDALIRLDAEVPAETLLALHQTAPDEAIILLARDPRRNQQALLSLFANEGPIPQWLAVGNLLAETRAPGFAARVLAGLKISAGVRVYDGADISRIGCGIGSGGYGCGVGPTPAGFPPVSFYKLTTGGTRGAVVVAPGRHTVYYWRGPGRGCPGGDDWGWRDGHRVEYIAGLLGATAEELKLEATSYREVVCQEERACLVALAAVRDGVVGGYAGAVRRLLDAELLDPAEAAELKPDITLHFYDYRGRKPFPLPAKLKGVKVEVSIFEPESESGDEEPAPDEPL